MGRYSSESTKNFRLEPTILDFALEIEDSPVNRINLFKIKESLQTQSHIQRQEEDKYQKLEEENHILVKENKKLKDDYTLLESELNQIKEQSEPFILIVK